MKAILEKLVARENLTELEIKEFMSAVLAGQVTEAQLSAFLIALKMKGETSQEIAYLAKTIQAYALTIPTQQVGAMDNCGTGGDQSNSFNVSTTACFVLAGAGIPVAKHGNRSISSKSGSADVLEALGINVSLTPDQLGQVFDQVGLVFLFAQTLHPAMKHIMPTRRQLELPTIMNLTGPLTNPIPLKTQLLGTSRPDLLEKTAQVLHHLGRERAIVVSGPGGMDEAALHGTTTYALLENGRVSLHQFEPEDVGMTRLDASAIAGGNAEENAQILLSVLKNEPSPYLETTVLNAGLGLYANGRATSIEEGIALAREIIASGKAYDKLTALKEKQYG